MSERGKEEKNFHSRTAEEKLSHAIMCTLSKLRAAERRVEYVTATRRQSDVCARMRKNQCRLSGWFGYGSFLRSGALTTAQLGPFYSPNGFRSGGKEPLWINERVHEYDRESERRKTSFASLELNEKSGRLAVVWLGGKKIIPNLVFYRLWALFSTFH